MLPLPPNIMIFILHQINKLKLSFLFRIGISWDVISEEP
jgi:hypothetical protein